MNKLFTKIGVAFVGIAMAVGVGVAVGDKKESAEVEAATSGVNATYELVSSNLSDWSGEFLIYSGNKLWDASSSISNDGTYVSNITPSNNRITTDTSYAWTIGSMTGGYYIKSQLNTNPYIKGGTSSGKVSTNASAHAHTITYNQGAFTISDGSYYLRLNSGKFRYYTNSGQGSGVQLFKKVESSDTIADSMTVSPSTALSVNEDDAIDTSIYTISGSKNGGAVAALASTDYTFQGCGTGTGSTFNSLSTTTYRPGATRIQWKANYPITAGTNNYAYVGISVTVKAEQAEYVKVTSSENLVAGHKYLIVEETANANSKYYAMKGVSSSLGQCAEITLDTTNHKITSKTNKGDAIEYTLGGESDAWTLKGNGVYLSYSGSSNNIQTSETATTNNQKWIVDLTNGKIKNKSVTSRYLQFNYNNGGPRFACYANTQEDVVLYEKITLEPSLSLDEAKEGYVGQTGVSLTATASNYTPDTFVWTSSNETVAEVSGSTATASLTLKAAGTSNIKIVASKGTTSVEKTCVLTVKAAPTAVQVKISGVVADSETVLEQFEGTYKAPNVSVLPEGASQSFVSEVQSETVSGAFTTNGNRINYVKPATGVIRFKSAVKDDVYFDLHVKCNEDTYTEDTLSYSGTPVTQAYGAAFDATGLTFSITKASGSKTINKNDLSFSPATMALDTSVVTATHEASGQSMEIPVTVASPISVSDALEVISALGNNETTTENYTIVGICSYAQDSATIKEKGWTTQTYRISDDSEDSNTLTIYQGTWIDGADIDIDDGHYVGVGDKIVVSGKLQKYVSGNTTTPEMIGHAPIVKITIYYSQILEWIGTYLHLDSTDTANYIAPTDNTQGTACKGNSGYYLTAKAALKTLDNTCGGAIDEFKSNQEADFADGYARYIAWAEANGDASPFDGEATISSGYISSKVFTNDDGNVTTIIIVIAAVSTLAIGGFFFLRKRKIG